MTYPPCKNANCKSFGHSHPNCKCYPDMAEGGEVRHFCFEDREHKHDCEYYADGGKVAPKWEDSEEIPTWENSTGEHDTLGQKLLTGVEGLGQGVIGPLMTGTELGLSKLGVPGLSAEDIKGREEANPIIHGASEAAGMAGSMFIGTGEAALFGKAATKALEAAKLAEVTTMRAKAGANLLKGAVEGGLYQGSDEITKAMLGQGDPGDVVASKLANGAENMLYGAATMGLASGLGSIIGSGLSRLAENKIGTKLHSFLAGFGDAAKGAEKDFKGLPTQPAIDFPLDIPHSGDQSAYEKGAKMFKNKSYFLAGGALSAGHDVKDLLSGNLEPEEAVTKIGQDILYSIGAGWAVKTFSPVVGAALIKTISNGDLAPKSLFKAIDYATQISRGTQKINKSVEALFKSGTQQIFNEHDLARKRDKLNEAIENDDLGRSVDESLYQQNGAVLPQGFANGGTVAPPQTDVAPILQDDPIANNFPDQHLAITAAKGRVSNYLRSLKPMKNPQKLVFDDPPDDKDRRRSYNRALDIANQPLAILNKIKKGTLELEHLQHFNNLYPELNNMLQKKLTEQIIHAQLKGEKPSYKIRQGLSLFMGAPLSGEFQQQNMMAAQATFQMQKQQSQQQMPKKTSAISKTKNAYMTANQAIVGRQQRQ